MNGCQVVLRRQVHEVSASPAVSESIFSRLCGITRWAIAVFLALACAGRAYAQQARVIPQSGRLMLETTDLSVSAGPLELDVRRILSHEGLGSGSPGRQWRLNWETSMQRFGDVVVLEDADALTVYEATGGNAYVAESGDRLEPGSDGGGVRTSVGGIVEKFDGRGLLVERDYGGGRKATLNYDVNARLARVGGPGGAGLVFTYDEDGRVQRIDGSDGNAVQYDYAGGDLARVRFNGVAAVEYAYDDKGRLSREETGATGATAFYYDDRGRVTRVRFADGSAEHHAYDDDANTYTRTAATGGKTIVRWSKDRTREEVIDPLGNKTVTTYDDGGRPLSITGADGGVWRYSYDDLGRLKASAPPGLEPTLWEYEGQSPLVKAVTYPGGIRQDYAYDTNGNVSAVREGAKTIFSAAYYPGGLVASMSGRGLPEERYEYYSDGRLKSVTDAKGHKTAFEYDGRGNLVRQTDAAGGATVWAYDGQNRATSMTDPSGAVTNYEYDKRGLLARETTPGGGKWNYGYDQCGRQSSISDPAGRLTRYSYDAAGRLVTVTGAGGHWWRYEYDAAGRIIALTNPLGGIAHYAYDQLGRLITETRADGTTRRYAYSASGSLERAEGPEGELSYQADERGRLTGVSGSDGTTVRYAYGEDSSVASLDDNRGRKARFGYDTLGRPERIEYGAGEAILLGYDATGNPVRVSGGGAGELSMRYDGAGRMVEMATADKAKTKYEYDRSGSLVAVTDPLGRVTRMAYGTAGELTQVVLPTGEATDYTPDVEGNPAEIRRPGGGVTRIRYDALGEATVVTDPMGRSVQHKFDKAGRLVRTVRADGGATVLTYDADGRLAREERGRGDDVKYAYDKLGRITAADDGKFPIRYKYDSLGRLLEIEYPAIKRRLKYAYDENGQLAGLTDSEGGSVSYEYDAEGSLAAIRPGDGSSVGFACDGQGRTTAVRYPNGVTCSIEYDAVGRIGRIAHTDASGQVVAGYRYEYNTGGELLRKTDARGRVTAYKYDAAGRLLSEEGPDGAVSYSYLAGGNRGERSAGGTITKYTYDAADRLLRAGKEEFRHDESGNLVERRGPSGAVRYWYDAWGRLVRVERGRGGPVLLGYAPTGERIWREDESGRTWYVTDGVNLLAELDAEKRPRRTYLHAPGVDRPIAVFADGKSYYLHADAIGSVIAVTDSSGRLVEQRETDAFGNLRANGGKSISPFVFTAREYDETLGLYYLRARYYDPGLGRFLSEDPEGGELLEPDTFNPYLYVLNRPTQLVDPFGLRGVSKGGWQASAARWNAELAARAKVMNTMPRSFNVTRTAQTQRGPGAGMLTVTSAARVPAPAAAQPVTHPVSPSGSPARLNTELKWGDSRMEPHGPMPQGRTAGVGLADTRVEMYAGLVQMGGDLLQTYVYHGVVRGDVIPREIAQIGKRYPAGARFQARISFESPTGDPYYPSLAKVQDLGPVDLSSRMTKLQKSFVRRGVLPAIPKGTIGHPARPGEPWVEYQTGVGTDAALGQRMVADLRAARAMLLQVQARLAGVPTGQQLRSQYETGLKELESLRDKFAGYQASAGQVDAQSKELEAAIAEVREKVQAVNDFASSLDATGKEIAGLSGEIVRVAERPEPSDREIQQAEDNWRKIEELAGKFANWSNNEALTQLRAAVESLMSMITQTERRAAAARSTLGKYRTLLDKAQKPLGDVERARSICRTLSDIAPTLAKIRALADPWRPYTDQAVVLVAETHNPNYTGYSDIPEPPDLSPFKKGSSDAVLQAGIEALERGIVTASTLVSETGKPGTAVVDAVGRAEKAFQTAEAALEIIRKKGIAIAVHVQDNQGRPVQGAAITADGRAGGATDGGGNARVRAAAGKDVTVTASAQGYEGASATIAAGSQSRAVTLVLAPRATGEAEKDKEGREVTSPGSTPAEPPVEAVKPSGDRLFFLDPYHRLGESGVEVDKERLKFMRTGRDARAMAVAPTLHKFSLRYVDMAEVEAYRQKLKEQGSPDAARPLEQLILKSGAEVRGYEYDYVTEVSGGGPPTCSYRQVDELTGAAQWYGGGELYPILPGRTTATVAITLQGGEKIKFALPLETEAGPNWQVWQDRLQQQRRIMGEQEAKLAAAQGDFEKMALTGSLQSGLSYLSELMLRYGGATPAQTAQYEQRSLALSKEYQERWEPTDEDKDELVVSLRSAIMSWGYTGGAVAYEVAKAAAALAESKAGELAGVRRENVMVQLFNIQLELRDLAVSAGQFQSAMQHEKQALAIVRQMGGETDAKFVPLRPPK